MMDACKSCGKKFTDHLGVIGTCEKLQKAEAALREVHKLPRTIRCSQGKLFEWARKALGGG